MSRGWLKISIIIFFSAAFISDGYQTKIETVSISPGRRLDEKYLSVIKPDGTSLQVGGRTLNVVLEKEVSAP
jgi:hypothetical protein